MPKKQMYKKRALGDVNTHAHSLKILQPIALSLVKRATPVNNSKRRGPQRTYTSRKAAAAIPESDDGGYNNTSHHNTTILFSL